MGFLGRVCVCLCVYFVSWETFEWKTWKQFYFKVISWGSKYSCEPLLIEWSKHYPVNPDSVTLVAKWWSLESLESLFFFFFRSCLIASSGLIRLSALFFFFFCCFCLWFLHYPRGSLCHVWWRLERVFDSKLSLSFICFGIWPSYWTASPGHVVAFNRQKRNTVLFYLTHSGFHTLLINHTLLLWLSASSL